MGEYFLYICISEARRVKAILNPLRGFGGMKWGEFIGTNKGKKLLQLLNKDFSCSGCKWIVVSDYGFSSVDGLDGALLYDLSKKVKDIGLNDLLRDKAKDLLAQGEEAEMWNRLTTTFAALDDKDPNFQPLLIGRRNLRSRSVQYFN